MTSPIFSFRPAMLCMDMGTYTDIDMDTDMDMGVKEDCTIWEF